MKRRDWRTKNLKKNIYDNKFFVVRTNKRFYFLRKLFVRKINLLFKKDFIHNYSLFNNLKKRFFYKKILFLKKNIIINNNFLNYFPDFKFKKKISNFNFKFENLINKNSLIYYNFSNKNSLKYNSNIFIKNFDLSEILDEEYNKNIISFKNFDINIYKYDFNYNFFFNVDLYINIELYKLLIILYLNKLY